MKVIDPAMRRVIRPIEGRRSRAALKGFRTENHRCQFLMAAFEYSRVSRLASGLVASFRSVAVVGHFIRVAQELLRDLLSLGHRGHIPLEWRTPLRCGWIMQCCGVWILPGKLSLYLRETHRDIVQRT